MTVQTAQVDGPLVSVIVCVYNGGALLRPAVLSILGQSYRNLEILVVDDGSTDGCVDSIRELDDSRIRILNQKNAGKAAALNLALDELRGEFYAIQDADDLSYPRRIERQYALFSEHAELAAVFCGHDLIFGGVGGRHRAPLFAPKSIDSCRSYIDDFAMPAMDPTAMYRVSAVQDMRYDEELPIVEGLDYVLRVGERHPMMVCGECLYSYRLTPGSVTRKDVVKRSQLSREAVVRAYKRRGVPEDQMNRPELAMAPKVLDNNVAAHFMDSVEDYRRVGRRWSAIRTGLQCMRMQPFDPYYWKALVYAIVPLWSLGLIRRRRRDCGPGLSSRSR